VRDKQRIWLGVHELRDADTMIVPLYNGVGRVGALIRYIDPTTRATSHTVELEFIPSPKESFNTFQEARHAAEEALSGEFVDELASLPETPVFDKVFPPDQRIVNQKRLQEWERKQKVAELAQDVLLRLAQSDAPFYRGLSNGVRDMVVDAFDIADEFMSEIDKRAKKPEEKTDD